MILILPCLDYYVLLYTQVSYSYSLCSVLRVPFCSLFCCWHGLLRTILPRAPVIIYYVFVCAPLTSPKINRPPHLDHHAHAPQSSEGNQHRACTYKWSSFIAKQGMDQPGVRLPILPWSTELGEWIFPGPHLRLISWSRETGSAVPSRISLFILHAQPESGAYSPDSSCFRRRRPFIYIVSRLWISPEFIGSPRNCVSKAFTAESPLAQGQ